MDVLSARWLPWLLVVAAGFNTCAGNLLLKQSRLTARPGWLAMLVSPWFLAGLAFYGLNVVLFAKALDRLPVSSAYPVFAGLGFLLLAVFSRIFFDESLSPAKIAGMALIVAGMACLALN
jgi:multidrug transporter EmrE-like cation transporter